MFPAFLVVQLGATEDEEEFFQAVPQGLPAGTTVAFSAQVATQSSQVLHELRDRQGLRAQLRRLSAGTLTDLDDRLHPLGWHYLPGGGIGGLYRQRPQP